MRTPEEVNAMKKAHQLKHVYSIYDVEMQAWTEPIVLRNDIEAKRLFKHLLEKDQFNGCPVEFYCIGTYLVDSISSIGPFQYIIPRRLFVEDTIEDGEVKENE